MALNILRHFLGRSVNASAPDFADRLPTLRQGNPKVDWELYNYPPILRLVHYQLNDVEDPPARQAVLVAHVNYLLAVTTLLLNLLVTVILTLGGVDRGVTILYSSFNLFLFATFGLYSFYNCYKGLATYNLRLTSKYLVIQVVVIGVEILFALASFSNFNGWFAVSKARHSEHMATFWFAWTIVESSLWTLIVALSFCALVLVAYTRTEGRPLGTLTSSSQGHTPPPSRR